MSRRQGRRILCQLRLLPHDDAKLVMWVDNDFLRVRNTLPFAYLGFLFSVDTTRGRDLRNTVLRVRHFSDRIDLKGGRVHFFVESAPSDTRWVLNDVLTAENPDFHQVLDSEETKWTRITGSAALEPILAGNSGDMGYDYLGFMVVGARNHPSGGWGLCRFSVGPVPEG